MMRLKAAVARLERGGSGNLGRVIGGKSSTFRGNIAPVRGAEYGKTSRRTHSPAFKAKVALEAAAASA